LINPAFAYLLVLGLKMRIVKNEAIPANAGMANGLNDPE
jgi:hypothetical protein